MFLFYRRLLDSERRPGPVDLRPRRVRAPFGGSRARALPVLEIDLAILESMCEGDDTPIGPRGLARRVYGCREPGKERFRFRPGLRIRAWL